jgi:hypothetical protein
MLIKLIWETSGDELRFHPVFPDLLTYYIDQLNKKNCNSFSCCYSEFHPDLISKLKANLHAISLYSSKIPMMITEWNGDLYDQFYLNRLHREWVNTGLKYPNLPLLLRALNNADEDFRDINNNLHKLESSFFYEFKNYDKDPFQIPNNFGLDILSFSTANLMLGFDNLGRSSWEKYKNWDNNAMDTDTNNFEMLSGLIQLTLTRPSSDKAPEEYMSWCRQFNVPVVGKSICLGNLIDLETRLTDYRKILVRNNNEQRNKFFFEICSQ